MAPQSDDEILAEIRGLAAEGEAARDLSGADTAKGYLRSLIGGATLNFGDEIEAAISSPFTGKSYRDELKSIRGEQSLFKENTDYLDNATEIAGSFINPFALLGRAGQAVGLLKRAAPAANALGPASKASMFRELLTPLSSPTASFVVNNPLSQGALAGVGAAENNGDILPAALGGGLTGLALWGGGKAVGNILGDTAREADRLKLSGFGVRSADVGKQLKKLDSEGILPDNATDLPLLRTLDKAAKADLIHPEKDLLTNASSLAVAQKSITPGISKIIAGADSVLPPTEAMLFNNSKKYLNSLVGTDRDAARKVFDEEMEAIRGQFLEGGSVADLQRAKVGLGKVYTDNPYRPNIIKEMRRDFRQAIEDRVKIAEGRGGVPPGSSDALHDANRLWGDLEELKDVFKAQARQDLQGDIVEDAFGAVRTSGGAGGPILTSANTGNPIPAVLGALATTVRAKTAKYKLGQMAEEFQKPLAAVGDAISAGSRARAGAQAYLGTRKGPETEREEKRKSKEVTIDSDQMKSLMDEIRALSIDEDIPETSSAGPSKVLFNPDGTPSENLIQALISVESGGNAKAKAKGSTASGILQFTKATAKRYGVDPWDEESSKAGARKKLAHDLKYLNGDVLAAIGAWEQGEGGVLDEDGSYTNPGYIEKVLKAAGV